MDAYTINDSIEQATVTLAGREIARIEDGKSATSWFDRFWTPLFVPSSCPTTAAL